jgi:hypothetical protein
MHEGVDADAGEAVVGEVVVAEVVVEIKVRALLNRCRG